MADFYRNINDIRNDFTNGSTTIARQALAFLMKKTVECDITKDLSKIKDLAFEIKNAKPGMSALRNITDIYLNQITSVEEKKDIHKIGNQILRKMDEAAEQCINMAMSELFQKENQSIITCSYSSLIIKLFRRVKQAGIDFNVIAIESTWLGKSYGKQLIEKLGQFEIKGELLSDNEIEAGVKEADFCLVGADSILLDGGIINGIPSKRLAMAAKDKISFYSVAESFKKSMEVVIEGGFDYVPAKLVKRIIMDEVFLNRNVLI